jgi:hypothetical protein
VGVVVADPVGGYCQVDVGDERRLTAVDPRVEPEVVAGAGVVVAWTGTWWVVVVVLDGGLVP